jgi:fatty-acyl-CoA synthase
VLRWAHETWTGALEAAAETPGFGFVFVDGKERETHVPYAEAWRRARALASALMASGVKAGERVAIILPTGQPFMDAFFGSQLAGAVPVPMYPPVRLGRLDEYSARTGAMLRACEAVVLLTDGRIRRLLGKAILDARPRLGMLEAGSLAKEGDAGLPLPGAGPDDPALIQFSSGTTRAPKGVELTHRQILANVSAIARHLPPETDVPNAGATWLPLYHDMGLIGCVGVAVCEARNLALIPPERFLVRPALWLRAISRHRAVISPAPNFAYGRCVQKITDDEMDGVDLSCWRFALNGAEPISPAVLEAFRARFAQWGLRPEALTPVYGLAEAALAVTFSQTGAPFVACSFDRAQLTEGRGVAGEGLRLVSVGQPLPGFEVEIRGAAGETVDGGVIGRVWARGPSLMNGYVGGIESAIRDGWLDTGDLGFIHQGELYITGRDKDVLVYRGRNHAPQDIEFACDTVDGVRTGCSVAAAHIGEDGERLIVFVEAREPTTVMAEACRDAIRAAVGLEVHEVLVFEPGTLPRTSSGKLRRAEAVARWRAGTLAPAKKVTRLGIVGEMAKSALAEWRAKR